MPDFRTAITDSTNRTIKMTTQRPTCQPNSPAKIKLIKTSINQSIKTSINRSIKTSINQLQDINQDINQSSLVITLFIEASVA